jgi:hypothetical protein
MGSLLRDKNTGEIVWIDFPSLLKNPLKIGSAIDNLLEKMAYPNENLEPAGILNQVLLVPPFAKQEHYGRLLEKLEDWGYQVNPRDPYPDDRAVYTFAYDWRQDNRLSARQLGEAIRGWRERHAGAKALLITHSNGGVVSRWYIQKEGGKDHVDRLLLMGSPWDGTPKSIKLVMDGLDVVGLRRLNFWNLGQRMKDLIRTFPSIYQLIPVENPFLRDENNEVVDVYRDARWLDTPEQREYLSDAHRFNQELEGDPGVETLCFYGTRKPTTTTGIVRIGAGGKWEHTQWIETQAGDGTIPERSAKHPWLPEPNWLSYPVSHGDIYVNEGVLAYLQGELTGAPPVSFAAVFLPDVTIVFEPERDIYAPGEEMLVWAEITRPGAGRPYQRASISAWLTYREHLPGVPLSPEGAAPPAPTRPVRLLQRKDQPGRYEARFPAPAVEGYYLLHASVKLVNRPAVEMEELVSVEGE